MASKLEMVQFICDQLKDAGEITYKKMFGEFGIYCDGKFFATVEDDQFCVKITEEGKAFLKTPKIIEPHAGAFYLHIEDLDNSALLCELTRITCDALPAPKPRKKKGT